MENFMENSDVATIVGMRDELNDWLVSEYKATYISSDLLGTVKVGRTVQLRFDDEAPTFTETVISCSVEFKVETFAGKCVYAEYEDFAVINNIWWDDDGVMSGKSCDLQKVTKDFSLEDTKFYFAKLHEMLTRK